MDSERLLFQIPAYRVSFDRWAADEDRRQAPYLAAESKYRNETDAAIWAQRLARTQPWDFNEVIAWIEVEGFHDVVKAYLWKRSAERIHRHPTQPFEFLGKLTELGIDDGDGRRVAKALRKSIASNCKEWPGLRRCHIDFRAFDHITSRLDWRELSG